MFKENKITSFHYVEGWENSTKEIDLLWGLLTAFLEQNELQHLPKDFLLNIIRAQLEQTFNNQHTLLQFAKIHVFIYTHFK